LIYSASAKQQDSPDPPDASLTKTEVIDGANAMQNLISWASMLFLSIVAQIQTFLICGLASGFGFGLFASLKFMRNDLISGEIPEAPGQPDVLTGLSLEHWDGAYQAAMASDARAIVQQMPIVGWHFAIGFAVGAVVFVLILNGATIYQLRRLSAGAKRLTDPLGAEPLESCSEAGDLDLVPPVVCELATKFNVPAPPVYLLQDEDGINAFVAGHRKSESILVVTHGLRHLNLLQLHGLIAHEMAHLSNFDVVHNTRLLALELGVNSVRHSAEWMLRTGRTLLFSGASNLRSAIRNIPCAIILLPLGVMIWPMGMVSSIAGAASMARNNRRRELRADRRAARILGSWEPIGAAIQRIMGHPESGQILDPECRKLGSLMFVQADGSSAGIFDPHPKMEKRVLCADPSWDGTPIYENSDEDFADDDFTDPSQLVDMQRVESALSEVDAATVNVFRDADAAMITIPALLLMNSDHRSIASSLLDETYSQPVEMLWQCIESIDPKERFALTELTFAATKDSSTSSVGRLLQGISDQLPGDAWSAWFWTQVFIDAIVDEQVPARVTMKDCRKCIRELTKILSLAASLDTGTDSARNMRELRFQRLWMATRLNPVDYIPCEEISTNELSKATEKLSHLPKAHLNIILKCLVESFESQDRVNPDQAAFLRYLTARWDTTTSEPPFTMISKTAGEPQLSFRR
jgi:Zn-dependent protease with chaperone function